jgi:D-sedoheptulose 7-phosphate isomerase
MKEHYAEEQDILKEYVDQGVALRERFFEQQGVRVIELARSIALHLARGGKVLFFGNGGSAADAQHLAAEFVSRFQMERPPLPALALTTDTSVLTAIGNDDGFEYVFSKQIKALAGEGDVAVGLSTSGTSPNVIRGLQTAKELGLLTAGLTGKNGGEVLRLCDYALHVRSESTALIQEVHISIGHMLCRMVDHFLFEAADRLELHGT